MSKDRLGRSWVDIVRDQAKEEEEQKQIEEISRELPNPPEPEESLNIEFYYDDKEED